MTTRKSTRRTATPKTEEAQPEQEAPKAESKKTVCRVPDCDATEGLHRELCPPHWYTHRGLAAPKTKEQS